MILFKGSLLVSTALVATGKVRIPALTAITVNPFSVTVQNKKPLAEVVEADGISLEYVFSFTPKRIFIAGIKQASWTAVGTTCRFDMPPNGTMVALADELVTVLDAGTVDLAIDSPRVPVVLNPGPGLSVPLAVARQTLNTQVTVQPSGGLAGLTVHQLTVLCSKLPTEGRVVSFDDDFNLSTDWTGVAAEKGFELYAE